jgi:hypothetical protein
VLVLLTIGGASLLWWQRRRSATRQTNGHESPRRADRNLSVGRRARRLFRGKKHNNPEPSEGPTSTTAPARKLDIDGQASKMQQAPEPLLIRDSEGPEVPSRWLPELPPHREFILESSVGTVPPPYSRASPAQTSLTLQRLHQDLVGGSTDGTLAPPPRALFMRQSATPSNYTESIISSAPSSRPSTIVYSSPLRPRPVPRNGPR